VPQDKLNPMTLRQDQRYLPRSMRRLTMLVSTVSVATAVLVFLFFPRNTGTGLLGPLQYRAVRALSGFSGEMNFQQVAQISQDTRQVAYVKVFEGDRNVGGAQSLLLRGVTLDIYTGNQSPQWQWKRTPNGNGGAQMFSTSNDATRLTTVDNRTAAPARRQEIILDPTGTETLFAMPGITQIRITTPLSSDSKMYFQSRDQTLRMEPVQDVQIRYEAISDGVLQRDEGDLDDSPNPLPTTQPATQPGDDSSNDASAEGKDKTTITRSIIDPQIEAYARREDVSGSDADGPLAARRPRENKVTDLAEKIAANIEPHLKGSNFSYTLDLRDAERVGDRDPMVAFLYDFKRGHCEYFAGAMTLMCQSLGLQARVVVGFKCDDFNNLTNSYMVRQNHAHAWVEVLNDKRQWVIFDPTSGRDLGAGQRNTGFMSRLKHLFDYLEYTWANSVVAYDRESRSNMISNVEVGLGKSAQSGTEAVNKARSWLDFDKWFDESPTQQVIRAQFWQKLVAALIAALVLAFVGALVWFFIERLKMRRRARRIGLVSLPIKQQLQMARQLGFYDEMIRTLARHGIRCVPHLTPGEFSRSVAFLPSELFDVVRRLTNIFYRIRYGHAELSGRQQRRLKTSISRLEAAMETIQVSR
jgi:transglutaminase-like putative cysteine protease